LKPLEWQHDICADMYLTTRVLYRYPQDFTAIAAEFPELMKSIKTEEYVWRDLVKLEKAPLPPCLGDREVFVPTVPMCGGSNIMAVAKGIFQFPASEKCMAPDVGPNIEYFACSDYAVSFVEYDGEKHFALYKQYDIKRYNRDLYTCYEFHEFISMPELIKLADECNDQSDRNRYDKSLYMVMLVAYRYHVFRDKLQPLQIDKLTFDKLSSL
jgi:hypothetical protein